LLKNMFGTACCQLMKRCVHQQRRGKIMRLFAVTVNFFFTLCLSDTPR
jgi:hypothetical protein